MRSLVINIAGDRGILFTCQVAGNDSESYRQIVGEKLIEIIENQFPVNKNLRLDVHYRGDQGV